MKMKICACFVSSICLLISPAQAATSILFLLDASNSMWGQVEGVAKMHTAKSVLGELISDLPGDTRVGLMTYGHRRAGDCGDVELLRPVAANARQQVVDALAAITPRGKTPIAASLEASAAAFAGLEGAKSVVLISDGVETCDGDPCAAAERLATEGIDVRVHVVGFDLTHEERAALDCIAEKGKGRYFAANSVESFAAAVTEAVEVAREEPRPEPVEVAQAAPAPATPNREEIWVEEFDGEDLAEPWTVINPNPDAYIVEEGELLIATGQPNGFALPEAENLVTRDEKLPRGDWDVTAVFRAELNTSASAFGMGLRKDDQNYVTASVFAGYGGQCGSVGVGIYKRAKGKETQFLSKVVDGCNRPRVDQLVEALAEGGGTLTLSKRGRTYFASLTISGEEDESGEPKVWTTGRLSSLRAPGRLTLGVDKWNAKAAGETLVFVDRIEAIAVEGEK